MLRLEGILVIECILVREMIFFVSPLRSQLLDDTLRQQRSARVKTPSV